MTFQLKIIAEQLHIIITFIIVCHNTAQDVFVDFALLSLHGDNLILEHILVLIRQISLLDSLEIDAFGVPDDKFDAALFVLICSPGKGIEREGDGGEIQKLDASVNFRDVVALFELLS